MKRVGIVAICALVSLGSLEGAWANSKKKPKKNPQTTGKAEKAQVLEQKPGGPALADAVNPDEGPPEGVFSEDEIRDADKPPRASDWPGYAQ